MANPMRVVIQRNGVDYELDLGALSNIHNAFTPSQTKTGIASQPAQNTFRMDSGVKRTISFSFKRKVPQNYQDGFDQPPVKWSNGFWIYMMKRYAVNRWQMATDGCKIKYIMPDGQTYMYPSIPLTNVYISAFQPRITENASDEITGSIQFTVGATNLSKVVADHTIIYHGNYVTYKPAVTDDTNMVNIANSDSIIVSAFPTAWTSKAIEYGITPGSTQTWNTKADGTGTSYSPGSDTLDLSEAGSVLDLYARY